MTRGFLNLLPTDSVRLIPQHSQRMSVTRNIPTEEERPLTAAQPKAPQFSGFTFIYFLFGSETLNKSHG